MNWFLIIVAIVMTVMLMIGSLYVLVYFQAEEDKNTAWAPKIAVVLGLTLACCVVLLLPMDVANRSTGSGLDMEGLYQRGALIAIMIGGRAQAARHLLLRGGEPRGAQLPAAGRR